MFVHPEKKPDEVFIGNMEMNHKEWKNPGKIGQRIGVKTLRRGEEPFTEKGEKIQKRKCPGFDLYGPHPLFVSLEEFEELKKHDPALTPKTLFQRILKANT